MKVLLADDGGRCSNAACEFLSQFPFNEPPQLRIVHVCAVPDLPALSAEGRPYVQQLLDRYHAEGEKLLAETASRCAAWSATTSTELLSGNPSQEILAVAEREQVDLIVLGSRGLGAVNRFLLGSVSERVATYARRSVLIIRGSRQDVRPELNNILIAYDGSAAATRAVDRFARMRFGKECRVTILGVHESVPHWGAQLSLEATPQWKLQAQKLQALLQQSEQKMKAAATRVQAIYLKEDNAAEKIVEMSEELSADLVVLGNIGKSAWDRLLLGSVAIRVLHHAHCSLWIERMVPIGISQQ